MYLNGKMHLKKNKNQLTDPRKDIAEPKLDLFFFMLTKGKGIS